MRAVIARVGDEELAQRRRIGLDRWDEMWEGVLHMPPAPNYEHQRIVDDLVEQLAPLLRASGRGTLRSGINVFHETTPRQNYRIPDLTFIAHLHESIIAEDGTRGGAPDAVIEIRSPDDETYEKLPFFASLGVLEVIGIDRDTKAPDIFRLTGSQYVVLQPDREGWLTSTTLDVRLKRGDRPTLMIEDRRDPSKRSEI